MKKYRVVTREVYCQNIIVEAENEEDAILRVKEGEGDEIKEDFVFDYLLDEGQWDVYEEELHKK